MIKFIRNKIKHWKDSKELKKSNWGRDYGWFIEYKGEIIGELIDSEFQDMFWNSYKIISKDKESEPYLFDEDLWDQVLFKFKNKFYDQYAEGAFSGNASEIKKSRTVLMRGLYLRQID